MTLQELVDSFRWAERLGLRPSKFQAAENSCVPQSGVLTNLGQSETFAINRKDTTSARIQLLLCGRLPMAIIGRIVSVVVDATKGMAGAWGQAHVCEKGLERLAPFITNSNTPH